MQESIEEVKAQVNPRRPILIRRVTCQYYSPTSVLTLNDEKRLDVVLELLQTEEKYHCCLHTLKSVFEDKLHSSRILPAKDIEAIFPVGLKEMREFHDRLYDILKQKVKLWNYRSTVGDIFVDFFSGDNQFNLIGHYSTYSNNFPKAIRTINNCVKKSHGFQTFLQSSSNRQPCKGLDLQALLLNPIQRLPRYLLLLKQLIKYTDANHQDRVHVEQAIATMSHTITVLNNSIQSSLKVACQYTTRKRATRRRSSSFQKDSIKVCHSTAEQPKVTTEITTNLKIGETKAGVTDQSRPVSICSSVSSGYASDEGDSSTLSCITQSQHTCLNNGAACDVGQKAFPRSVQEVQQQSSLLQIAQQNFDFADCCISPTLQHLHFLKIGTTLKQEIQKDETRLLTSPRRKNAVPFQECDVSTNLGSTSMKETKSMCIHEDNYELLEVKNKTLENHDEPITTNGSTINDYENTTLLETFSKNKQQNVLEVPICATRPVSRSYSDVIPVGLQRIPQGSCSNENDLSTTVTYPSSIKKKLSIFQRFRRDRRSWAPRSSFAKEYDDKHLAAHPFNAMGSRRSLHGDDVDDDSISILSDVSTLSGMSTFSGVSTLSVNGRKRYFKLKTLFKQFPKRGSSLKSERPMPSIPQGDVINIQSSHRIPRMMISTV